MHLTCHFTGYPLRFLWHEPTCSWLFSSPRPRWVCSWFLSGCAGPPDRTPAPHRRHGSNTVAHKTPDPPHSIAPGRWHSTPARKIRRQWGPTWGEAGFVARAAHAAHAKWQCFSQVKVMPTRNRINRSQSRSCQISPLTPVMPVPHFFSSLCVGTRNSYRASMTPPAMENKRMGLCVCNENQIWTTTTTTW